MKTPDLTGVRFGRLTAFRSGKRSGSYITWDCICDCGRLKNAIIGNLTSGKTQSCGCLQKERTAVSTKTHGLSDSSEYGIWGDIHQRCYNPKREAFKHYGGRGITVCRRWKNFEAFLSDMGRRPSSRHTIERLNNDKGYSPSNCKWVDIKEQARNRRSNRLFKLGKETLCIAAWAERYAIKPGRVFSRIYRGWSVIKALKTPLKLTK